MKMTQLLTVSGVMIGLWLGVSAADGADRQVISIGTSGVDGIYYPTGRSICHLVNKNYKHHGVRCSVEATSGSVFNIESIRAGELDLGLVRSDFQHHAYKGTWEFKSKGPFDSLRSIFSLQSEPFTIVARKETGIKEFVQLKGKRVSVGINGSTQRNTMNELMHALGWSVSTFKRAIELESVKQVDALCENKVDAIAFAVGHPSKSIKEVTSSCNSVFVKLSSEAIDTVVANSSFYRHAVVPGGMYRGNVNDVKTFGLGATLLSSTKLSEQVVYTVVKAVFKKLKALKALHPAFAFLKKKQMIKDSLSAPLHDGAIRYYREAGLM